MSPARPPEEALQRSAAHEGASVSQAGTAVLSAAEQIVADVQARWAQAFCRADWLAMQALYAPDAQLFGGKQALYTGHAGVLRYFETIPLQTQLRAEYDRPHVMAPTPETIVAAGYVRFGRGDAVPAGMRTYRMTQMLVQRAAQWLICSHHASPKDVFALAP